MASGPKAKSGGRKAVALRGIVRRSRRLRPFAMKTGARMTDLGGGGPIETRPVKTVRKKLTDGTIQVYRYHRETGRRVEGEPGSEEFERSWLEASRPIVREQRRRDIAWLIDRYERSPEWESLARATKESRRSYFRKIIREFGFVALAAFERDEIITDLYDWRDGMTKTPVTADHCLDALRVILGWGKKRRLIRHNWASEITRLTPASHNRAEKTWEPELWERLLAVAGDDERQLLQFAYFSCAREADIAAMRWSMFDGKWLTFKPQKTSKKTGVVVDLPIYALEPFAALLRDLSRASDFLLTTRTGQPWTTANIKLRMRALKVLAFPEGDPDRTFHDIRGTGISALYAAGCTDAEVASIDGHSIGGKTMLGRYAKRDRQLAINAYTKWQKAAFEQAEIIPFPAFGNRS